jgi:hypothetical protein
MKLLNTKILFAFLSMGIFTSSAQEIQPAPHKWYVPKSATVQYAGSIGYFSAGIGYHLNKSGKSTLDFMYGYVPVAKGGDLSIITGKFAWRPFKINLTDWAVLHPINPGAFLSYHAGSNFDSKWDDNEYPKGYYWWSTAFRPHISFSTEVKVNTKKLFPALKLKSITLYSEANTNELYAISYFQNKRDLNLDKIFKLGLGAKVHF